MTTVRQAKDIAREWVNDQAHGIEGFAGACLSGSAIWLPDAAMLPPTSDVDITIVLDTARVPAKVGKFPFRNVVLDVSYLSMDQLRPADAVLGDYHLAGTFRRPGVIADPTGALTALHADVAREFARRHWVRRRSENARDKVLAGLEGVREDRPWPDNVLAWLFPAGVTTHILLVAGLRSPTIRTRYLAVRDLLADTDHQASYPSLLELLGCAGMSKVRAACHLDSLTTAFDAASAIGNTDFPFSSDISTIGRPVAIEGSRDLIERGDHREAVFWLVATYSRCQAILARDAPALARQCDDGYRALLGDLGIASFADLEARAETIREALPGIMNLADRITDATPGIEND